jgi:hypothetical protein
MSASSYLTWVLAGLFVVCGLPLAVVEDSDWRNTWGGLSLIGLGGFALSMVRDAVKSGEIRLNFSRLALAAAPQPPIP